MNEPKAALLPELPPFGGGAVGYAGYDVVRYAEHLPNAPQDDRGLPDLAFGFYDRMVVFDNVDKTMYVVVTARVDGPADADRAYAEAQRRVDQTVAELSDTPVTLQCTDIHPVGEASIPYRSELPPGGFRRSGAQVRRVHPGRRHLSGGDQPAAGTGTARDPFEIYRTLRVVNPSPFMFFLRTPQVTLVGSSPEIMCRVVERQSDGAARWPARAAAGRPKRTIAGWPRNCWPIPRSGPST